MSIYKIKLLKQFVVDITVTNSKQIVVPVSDHEIILGNRGEIISCAIDIETKIDRIISNLLFDQRSSDSKKLFKEFFLSQEGITIHTKERALSRLLEAKGIYENDADRKQLISKIVNIEETRNRFAHGKIDLRPPSGAYLEYYKKDGLNHQKLDAEYWKEVENLFNTTVQLLSELSEKVEGLQVSR